MSDRQPVSTALACVCELTVDRPILFVGRDLFISYVNDDVWTVKWRKENFAAKTSQ